MSKVVVYSKPGCGMCTFTKEYLKKKGVEFEEVDVTKKLEGLTHIKSLGYSGLPVVEFKDVHFNGFKPQELDKIVSEIEKEA